MTSSFYFTHRKGDSSRGEYSSADAPIRSKNFGVCDSGSSTIDIHRVILGGLMIQAPGGFTPRHKTAGGQCASQ